jgi:hypothetical protein
MPRAAVAIEPARPELPPGWPQVLRAVVEAPRAWITRSELARRLQLDTKRGSPLPILAGRIEAMITAGWLDPWDAEGERRLTLSALAAEQLGCRLAVPPDAHGNDDPEREPRWERATAGVWPRACRREFDPGEVTVQAVSQWIVSVAADPLPPPDEQAAEREEFSRAVQVALRAYLAGRGEWLDALLVSRPRSVLMGADILWWEQIVRPGQEFEPRPYCSACKGLPLSTGIPVCIRCFRWAFDDIFRRKPAVPRTA